MLKRYIIHFLFISGSILLLFLDITSWTDPLCWILLGLSLFSLINTTDIFHREKSSKEEGSPELMDPRAADVLIQKGSKKAVLLVHGFSSCPWLFHKHIPLFEAAGYDVIAPRLPGHGISPEVFVKSSFTQYYNKVEECLLQYRLQYESFHVIGISMGGLLTLKLAEEYSEKPEAPDSIITLAAPYILKDPRLIAIRFLSWFKPILKGEWSTDRESDGGESWIGYEDLFIPQAYSLSIALVKVRSNLKKITLPHMLIHAREDKDVPFESLWKIASSTSSKLQELWTPDLSGWDHSRHALFLYDSIKDELSTKILTFLESDLSSRELKG
jgi:carboxylesterase